MSDLKARIEKIYAEADDWGHETNRQVELEIGLSLTPAERLRWLEESLEELGLASERAKASAAQRRA